MQKNFDVIVVGLGAMGSAALFQLAKRGVKVLGIDRFQPPHNYGSTHGETRITRLAIGEGTEYVPFVIRSHELWREIETETGYDLITQCGGLVIARRGNTGAHHGKYQFLKETIKAAEKFNIKHETLTTDEIKNRYPQFNLVGDEEGYYEPSAGFVRPEKCIEAQLELARKHGAHLKTNERVLSYEVDSNNNVTVKTENETYTAQKIILSAGAWIKEFLQNYQDHFKIYRQVLYWFELEDNFELYKRMPIFIWMYGIDTNNFFYGFPSLDSSTIKIAGEEFEIEGNPDDVKRDVAEKEIRAMYENFIKGRMKGVSDKCVKTSVCLYTQTPDSSFVIDFHPEHENVIIASPCSGHGFKHSAAIGETLAELTIDGVSKIDISKFNLRR